MSDQQELMQVVEKTYGIPGTFFLIQVISPKPRKG